MSSYADDTGPSPTGSEEQDTYARHMVTVNDEFLDKLFDTSSSAMCQPFPGRISSPVKDRAFGQQPPHSAIAGVRSLDKLLYASVLEPCRDILKSHPEIASSRAEISWEAPRPSTAPRDWQGRESLYDHLRGSLFRRVEALLEFLPPEYKLSFAYDDEEGDKTMLRVIATPAASTGNPITSDSRVVMVVEIAGWLSHPEMDPFTYPRLGLTAEELLKRPHRDRWDQECHEVALQRLSLAMRAYDAPVGVIYNGCDIIVIERDFSHDMRRVRQLSAAVRAGSKGQGVTRELRLGSKATATIIMDIQLRPWMWGFSHPLDPGGYRPSFTPANPVAVFEALALYSLRRLQARPKALDDVRIKGLLADYLAVRGTCPCSESALNATSMPSDDGPSTAAQAAYPETLTELLQVVELASTPPNDAHVSAGSSATTSSQHREDRLIAVGLLTCPPNPNRAYIFVAALRRARPGRIAVVYEASLHIVTEAEATAAADAMLATSLILVPRKGEYDPAHGTFAQRDTLYLTSHQVVDELVKRLHTLCGLTNVFEQDVVLKLPMLSIKGWTPWRDFPSIVQDNDSATSLQRDPLSCRCPLGLCDAVCPACTDSAHAYELAGLKHHVDNVVQGFEIEDAALRVLNHAQSRSDIKEVRITPILRLRPAFQLAQSRLVSAWPLLGPVVSQSWPVFLHAGVPLRDLFGYARAAYRGKVAAPDEGDELYEMPEDEAACKRLFDYFSKNDSRIVDLHDTLYHAARVLHDSGLMSGRVHETDVFLQIYDKKTLDLFRGQPDETWQRAEDALEKPRAQFVNLSTYGFVGDPASLNTGTVLGRCYDGQQGRESGELRPLGSSIANFAITWYSQERAGGVLPSAAPMDAGAVLQPPISPWYLPILHHQS